MNLFNLGMIFLPALLVSLVFNFIYGSIKYKLISSSLLILALLSFYKAFEAGLALKNTEISFVKNNYGKYSKYSNLEKNTKIKELKEKQKSRKINFIVFSILYWMALFGAIFITLKTFRKYKNNKPKSTSPPIIANNSCGDGSV